MLLKFPLKLQWTHPSYLAYIGEKKENKIVRRIVSSGILLLQTSDSNADLRNTDNRLPGSIEVLCAFKTEDTLT